MALEYKITNMVNYQSNKERKISSDSSTDVISHDLQCKFDFYAMKPSPLKAIKVLTNSNVTEDWFYDGFA
ncbi:TPA: hypothetical protein ACXYKX_003010, partial [Legionella pneumophila]